MFFAVFDDLLFCRLSPGLRYDKGRWILYGDTIAANLGHSTMVDGVDIDPTIKILFLTLGGYYRLGTWDLMDDGDPDLQESFSFEKR